MSDRISLVDVSSRRRRTRRTLFWGGLALAFGLLAAGAVWAAVYSDLFKIRQVEVSGAAYVDPESVREFMRGQAAHGPMTRFLGPDNILAWPDEISPEELVRSLPAAAGLDVDKDHFRRRVLVGVTARERVGIWCFDREEAPRCYWFDRDGVLFLPAYAAEGNLTPVLRDASRDSLELGSTAIEKRLLDNLLSVFSALKAAPLSIREVRLEDLALEEVVALTYDGPRLLFSLRHPAHGAPTAIEEVAELAPLASLQYIDFRVENKVYYK